MVVETHTGLREQPTRAMSRPEQTWAAPGRFSLKRFLYYSTHLLTRWRGPWSWWCPGKGSWLRLVKFLSILTLRNWYLTCPSGSILLFWQNSIWIWPGALFATSIYELVVAALKKSKQADNWGRICLLERLLKKRSLEKEYCATFNVHKGKISGSRSELEPSKCFWQLPRTSLSVLVVFARSACRCTHLFARTKITTSWTEESEWATKRFLRERVTPEIISLQQFESPSPTLVCSSLACNVNSSRCLLQRIATIREDLERKRRKSKS